MTYATIRSKPVRHTSTAVEAEVQAATAAAALQRKYSQTSLDTIRAYELVEDIAAIKKEARRTRNVPFSTFKTIEQFEQELEI